MASVIETVECCGKPTIIDRTTIGITAGGIETIGGSRCQTCGTHYVCKGVTQPTESAGGWSLAKGGRSVNCGGIRVRAEGKQTDDTVALMARIVRLPELEAEVERLRALLAAKEAA